MVGPNWNKELRGGRGGTSPRGEKAMFSIKLPQNRREKETQAF